MISSQKLSFPDFLTLYPTEKEAMTYYIKCRYHNKIQCNHCSSFQVYQRSSNPRFFDCIQCQNSFSIFKGTIFERTTTDFRKWIYVIHLFLTQDKKISASHIQKEIGVTYKTAWRMVHQINLEIQSHRNEFIHLRPQIDKNLKVIFKNDI